MFFAKRLLPTLFVVSAFFLPAAAAAEISACPALYRTLGFGYRGTDVVELQYFLISHEYLDAGSATGFFGRKTESAVRYFQHTHDVSPTGVVGLKTRAVVALVCGRGDSAPATTQYKSPATPPMIATCVSPERPTLSCSGAWQPILDAKGCGTGWVCVAAATKTVTNLPPVISALTGPATLNQNDTGTWSISASDPENAELKYSIIWGDEGANVATLINITQEGTPYSTTSSYAHRYEATGSYTIVAFAKDAAGNTVKATFSVTVQAASNTQTVTASQTAPTTQTTTSTNAGSASASCLYKGQNYAEGQTVTDTGISAVCDNGAWLITNLSIGGQGISICTSSKDASFAAASFGCSSAGPGGPLFGVTPRHGTAPFTVAATAYVGGWSFYTCRSHTINWGDGLTETFPRTSDCGNSTTVTHTHTYTAKGSYSLTYSDEFGTVVAATIRAD